MSFTVSDIATVVALETNSLYKYILPISIVYYISVQFKSKKSTDIYSYPLEKSVPDEGQNYTNKNILSVNYEPITRVYSFSR